MQDSSDQLSQVSPVGWFAAVIWSLATADAAVVCVRWLSGTLDPAASLASSVICGIVSILLCLGSTWVDFCVIRDGLFEPNSASLSFPDRRSRIRTLLGFAAWTIPGIIRGTLGSGSTGSTEFLVLVAVAVIATVAVSVFVVRGESTVERLKSPFPQLHNAGNQPPIPTIPLRASSSEIASQHSPRVSSERLNSPIVDPAAKTPHLSVVSVDTDAEHPEENWSTGTRLQWTCRTLREDRAEEFEGTFRVTLAAGQKTSALHIPFCPPLPSTPEVSVELLDEEGGMRWKAAAVHPYGLRIELRRGSSECTMDVVVSVRAVASAASATRAV